MSLNSHDLPTNALLLGITTPAGGGESLGYYADRSAGIPVANSKWSGSEPIWFVTKMMDDDKSGTSNTVMMSHAYIPTGLATVSHGDHLAMQLPDGSAKTLKVRDVAASSMVAPWQATHVFFEAD